MNISYNWLCELTGSQPGPREMAELLTRLGLAVEVVHEAGEDFLLEIDLTSNRPDCLSHLGVAREAAAATGGSVRLPQEKPSRTSGRAASVTSVEIQDTDLCPRYAARVIKGVRIGPSPDWLVRRLEAIGQRPINNVADITNYVMHEQGQPLHAFDLAKLRENRIVVRRALPGEKVVTLDGVERELDEQMLVIADAERASAIAGVMGGEESEISAETKDVLIESAYFDPASVRRTSKLLGMRTEASYRFERGVDYGGVLRAQERCVALICELAGGEATEDAVDIYPEPIEPPRVSLRPERVKALTGLDVPADEARRILLALGFAEAGSASAPGADQGSDSTLNFVAPSWRVDVEIEDDLVEEVARHWGYEKIGTELPASAISGEYQPSERKRRALRRAMTAVGYDEAVGFSFIDAATDGRFDLLPGFAGEPRFVTLSNPIIEGVTRMRPTLLAGLLDAVRNNFNHGTRDVRLFETGRVFAAGRGEGELPEEREALAIVATGGAIAEGRAGSERELDFYDVKGALDMAADAMKIGSLRFRAASFRHLRDGQAALVTDGGGRALGSIGRLDEGVASLYKFRQAVYVAEVDLGELLGMEERPVLYTPLARYPGVVRDVSLLVGRNVTLAEMLDVVSGLRMENCRGAKLVDVYEGANLPEGKRSVTLRVEYRADDRTLRDEDVDEAHAQVVRTLAERFGASQR